MLSSACSKEESKPIIDENIDTETIKDFEVLFIGNSHTYYNSGLAHHLNRFRKTENENYDTYIKEVSFGGFSLADHINNTTAISKINERDWDFIVLQENTFVAANEGESTLAALNKFNEVLGQKRAKVYLFMTWEYKDEPDMYQRIKNTYDDGSLATGAQIVPVGQVWRQIARDSVPNINLYNEDGFHPALQGTFLAAAMFYKKIYGKNPSDNSYKAGLESEVAEYLKLKAN